MATAAAPKQRTFLGHPLGLYILFFTEMWERFSYYGMRALLIVYMLNYFRWSQQESSYIFKIYTSLVYVTPILGGYLADRYLGNRRAVIIGALLMAVGHFLMAFDEFPIFMSALVFLIIGNGFFKPNMSTQVGRLYPANDGRRDGAYTIFYMGINLGAFLSPLVCGWLAENTVGGYHSGFTMAGIGMMAGLVVYLVGQPFIKEIPTDAAPATDVAAHPRPEDADAELKTAGTSHPPPLTEAEAERAPSVLGSFSDKVPLLLYVLGGGLVAWALGVGIWSFIDKEKADIFDAVAFLIGGGCLTLIGYLIGVVRGALRDRILAILVLAIFLVFFWGAFEQAGNVHNVWADQFTNRYLTEELKAPATFTKVGNEEAEPERLGYWDRFTSLFPNMVTLKKREGSENLGWWETIQKSFNPIPTAWYLSINALLIVLLAPLFAWMWIALDRRGRQPSIPMKMVMGVAFMSASMAVMMQAARQENQRSEIAWQGSLPKGIVVTEDHKLAHGEHGKETPFDAGRLTLDKETGKLVIFGVLDKNVCDLLIETTAPEKYEEQIKELKTASAKIDGDKVKSAEIQLASLPPGFDWKYAGLKKSVVRFDPDSKKLTAYRPLDKKEMKGLGMAAGDPKFRETILDLYVESSKFRVSMWWLFWSYFLATVGELCLSPVGLSMVSKLAPARFATMLMGFWLIISFFGNFAAGAMGEQWGTMPPINFFMLTTVVVGAAALVLLIMVKWVTSMMHGVR